MMQPHTRIIVVAVALAALALALVFTASTTPSRGSGDDLHYVDVIHDLIEHRDNVDDRIRHWFALATETAHARHLGYEATIAWDCNVVFSQEHSDRCHHMRLTVQVEDTRTAEAELHTPTPSPTATPTPSPRPTLTPVVVTRIVVVTATPTPTATSTATATPIPTTCANQRDSEDLQRIICWQEGQQESFTATAAAGQ